MNETIECSYRAGSVVVTKYATSECPSTNSKADIENAIKFLQVLLEYSYEQRTR